MTKGDLILSVDDQLVDDIGSDFSTTLAKWGEMVSSLASSFALSRKPDSTERMAVLVDGDEVDSEDWKYDANTQSIVFINEYIPDPGADIEVHYEFFNEFDGFEDEETEEEEEDAEEEEE